MYINQLLVFFAIFVGINIALPAPKKEPISSITKKENGVGSRTNKKNKGQQYAWEKSGKFQGDILIDPNLAPRNGLRKEEFLWPLGIVPVYIPYNIFNYKNRQIINAALSEIENKTCIRFREVTTKDKSFVYLQSRDKGCYSLLGRVGEYPQRINLNLNGCMRHEIIIHEFLHALGFIHEHNAPDRDQYIKIFWDNIEPEEKSQFNATDFMDITHFNLTYDYNSIMHYSSGAFSKNGYATILTNKYEKLPYIDKMSKTDIIKVEKLYGAECKKRENRQTTPYIRTQYYKKYYKSS